MMTLSEIKTSVEARAAQVGATADMLPTYDYIRGDATPYVEMTPSGYHYVISERGQEYRRDTTRDIDELLYLIFYDITFQIASNYEMRYRAKDRDARRLHFSYQEELLLKLSHRWAERARQLHEHLIRERPYDDNAWLRSKLWEDYWKAGYTSEKALEMASEQFPLPKKTN